MNDILSALSTQLADAAQTASASIVQLQARRRLAAGVVFADDLVVTSAQAIDAGTIAVRHPDGRVLEGTVVGHAHGAGIAVVRVPGLGAPGITPAAEPRTGALTLAVGRTWSGNLFTMLAPVAVVGGPLRTGRTTEIARVVRVGIRPHGALVGGALVDGAGHLLGLITAATIRGTTIVIPAGIAIEAARDLVGRDGARPGFIGVSTMPVTLAARQQQAGHTIGALLMSVTPGSPAEDAGALVGDVIVAIDDAPIGDVSDLSTRLQGRPVGKAIRLTILRGDALQTLTVTPRERTAD